MNIEPSLEITTTPRGFQLIKFSDIYDNKCTLQKSSLSETDAIWFGVQETKLTVFEDENMGKYLETSLPKNWSVNTRMHLSREQVKELLPMLTKFVRTGELI